MNKNKLIEKIRCFLAQNKEPLKIISKVDVYNLDDFSGMRAVPIINSEILFKKEKEYQQYVPEDKLKEYATANIKNALTLSGPKNDLLFFREKGTTPAHSTDWGSHITKKDLKTLINMGYIKKL